MSGRFSSSPACRSCTATSSMRAGRGQLPYIVDGDHTVGDSDEIIAHRITTRRLVIDTADAYGFLANSWLCPIDTPLRGYIAASGNLGPYCERLHAMVTSRSVTNQSTSN